MSFFYDCHTFNTISETGKLDNTAMPFVEAILLISDYDIYPLLRI